MRASGLVVTPAPTHKVYAVCKSRHHSLMVPRWSTGFRGLWGAGARPGAGRGLASHAQTIQGRAALGPMWLARNIHGPKESRAGFVARFGARR